ncbi:site-specific DNA-methyltransferase [Selenomonas sp. oral taxon 138]|uniref:DNA methyltransferase n=1 Tax=Selenomonas sp. oral taxon 138 TaxID=712532 RepID=UPI0002A30B71|nr:site-specific DNA-methyltransferase [Selenomonas sp. oral taxon 138]EKY00533.1 DNA (cytosine-5-)-methyltransferase [Selenomonas sp. oral taxon 138 str. F0429]
MSNFYETVLQVLKSDRRFVAEDGTFLRNAVYEAAMQMDAPLLRLLLANPETAAHFFKDVGGVKVFDKMDFAWTINNRQFLPDSYTRFKNKIGLTDEEGNLIATSEKVELVFPYKDCVLEGGQTREDQKRQEIFYNSTLAPDEVTRLLYPKVLTQAKRYSADGVSEAATFSDDDNLIIKGNNLLALSSLLKRYEGRIKCICIDPPYNRKNSDFGYNDNFNHSTWLTFMKTRLEISMRLLSTHGTTFVFCDDNEQAYLKVLMDGIFGRNRYVQTVIWRNSDNSNNDAKQFSQDHNYILVYSNNEGWESYKLDRTETQATHYKNPDNDPRGPWFDGNPVNSPNPRPNLQYTITAPNGNIINPPVNGWRWNRQELIRRMSTGEIRFNESGTGIIRRTYLNEQKGLPPSTLWDICESPMWINIEETGHTRQAKYEQKKLSPNVVTSDLFKTPKPERVIKRIYDISTKEGDIVLDFFGGSGTSAAVAHKMNRRYILCEQMDYIETFIVDRLKKVIDGEDGGISKEVDWKGGGSFVYCELAKLNQTIVEEIEVATNDTALSKIRDKLMKSGFISYKVNPRDINEAAADYAELSMEDKKRFLMDLLDKNLLYVNYCDIDDAEFGVSEQDKAFTRSFYKEV